MNSKDFNQGISSDLRTWLAHPGKSRRLAVARKGPHLKHQPAAFARRSDTANPTHSEHDNGPCITAGLVIARSPVTGIQNGRVRL